MSNVKSIHSKVDCHIVRVKCKCNVLINYPIYIYIYILYFQLAILQFSLLLLLHVIKFLCIACRYNSYRSIQFCHQYSDQNANHWNYWNWLNCQIQSVHDRVDYVSMYNNIVTVAIHRIMAQIQEPKLSLSDFFYGSLFYIYILVGWMYAPLSGIVETHFISSSQDTHTHTSVTQ